MTLNNGLVLHYDSTDLTLNDGDPISALQDSSGLGGRADLTGGSGATYSPNSFGSGIAGIDLDGSSDSYLRAMGGATYNVKTMVIVFKMLCSGSNPTHQYLWDWRHYLAPDYYMISDGVLDTGGLNGNIYIDGALSDHSKLCETFSDGNAHILYYEPDKSVTDTVSLRLFARYSDSHNTVGVFGEFQVYDVWFDDLDRHELLCGLAAKWGVTHMCVPSSQPTSSPTNGNNCCHLWCRYSDYKGDMSSMNTW